VNETQTVWYQCTHSQDGELARSVSQWQRYRLLEINRNGIKPTSAKWQVVKATVGGKLSPETPVTVEDSTFSIDPSMFWCGKRVVDGKVVCEVSRPSALVSCHSIGDYIGDCGFSAPVTTQEMTYGQFTQNYWAIEEPHKESKTACTVQPDLVQ